MLLVSSFPDRLTIGTIADKTNVKNTYTGTGRNSYSALADSKLRIMS